MFCKDALDPFSSGFSHCWSSGYSNAVHHPAQTVAIAAAVVTVVLVTAATAGADLIVLASVGGGTVIDAGVDGAGDAILITSGTQITAASVSGVVSTTAAGVQTYEDCSDSLNAKCAWDLATLGIGSYADAPGLPGSDSFKSLLGLGSTYPYPFDSGSNPCSTETKK